MRDLFSNQHRALYQFGGFHELSRITEDEWRTGLGERFAQDGCTFDEEALELIIASGEGHPRSTMLIAQQTHHTSVEEDTRHIDGTLAERGYRGALADDAGRHSDLMERIQQYRSRGHDPSRTPPLPIHGPGEEGSQPRAEHARRRIDSHPARRAGLMDVGRPAFLGLRSPRDQPRLKSICWSGEEGCWSAEVGPGSRLITETLLESPIITRWL